MSKGGGLIQVCKIATTPVVDRISSESSVFQYHPLHCSPLWPQTLSSNLLLPNEVSNNSTTSSGEKDEELRPAIQSAITQRASITATKTLYHVVPYEIRNKT